MAAAAVPTVQEVADRLRVDSTDEDFVLIYDTATQSQADDCDTSEYDSRLAEGLYRRCANLWASKAHTLGVLDTGTDYGISYVPRYDPVLDMIEAPYRNERTVVA